MFNNKDNTPKQTRSKNPSAILDTMLGENTQINGDMNFNGLLNLDGSVVGSIKGTQNDDKLIVTESGKVEGKIEVANIIINGLVKGDIIATGKIEVASKADIQGNIYYKNIEMEAGSKINGQLIYQDDDKSSKISKIDDKRAK